MSTPVSTAGPGSTGATRAGGLIASAVMVGYVAAIVWIALGRPPLRAHLWHGVMRACQRTAAAVGARGIDAETRYTRAVSDGSYAD